MNKAIQDVADILANSINTVDSSLRDGFQPSDLFGLIPIATAVPQVVSEKNDLVAAWKGRSSEDLAEWVGYIKTKITLQNAKTERKIEKILALAFAAIDVYDEFSTAEVAE